MLRKTDRGSHVTEAKLTLKSPSPRMLHLQSERNIGTFSFKLHKNMTQDK